jgi:4-hydroxybenzoate polyprenyltransferase
VFDYIVISRVDHWVKQVFCISGIVLAIALEHAPVDMHTLWRLVLTFFAVSITASSNYVINEDPRRAHLILPTRTRSTGPSPRAV